MHEASLYDDNCFVTITYNDDNLPASGSINKRDLQLFLKRLRKAVEPHKIRFFACGEYGDQLSRPHYHVLFFGYDFPDKIFWRFNKQQQKVYRSKLLEDCWQYGYSTVGNLTKQSVDYVCRYVLKKITGKAAVDHYGERIPEFVLMSRRPGIGRAWIETYTSDVYPKDFCVVNGRKQRPPAYYDKYLQEVMPNESIEIKAKRMRAAELADPGLRRLDEIEHVKELYEQQKSRDYEEGV